MRPRHISQRQDPDHVGPDRLGSVVLAPVDIWPPGDSGSIEDVGWLHSGNVLLDPPAILEPVGTIFIVDAHLGTKLAEQTTDPASPVTKMMIKSGLME